jgi:aspartyl-tRNA synthetase
MLRTHNCGELRLEDKGKTVTLCGWVRRVRDKGALIWVDLRDRFGITQLYMEEGVTDAAIIEKVRTVGREFVLKATGKVVERTSKNAEIPTGEIEIVVTDLQILNAAKTPPFLIEDHTDGGDDLRMKYRYLDIRRNPVQEALVLRHKMAQLVRRYLDQNGFLEIETPFLIKSTPEGARDFVVPSRMHQGEFYALPQSPQTFKQILMVAGMDRYFQIVRCFRDEDLRADRQPEFTQIDCEMSFVEREDILQMFEGLIKFLFRELKGIELGTFPRMSYDDAMRLYGSDKPDLRFGMQFVELNDLVKGKEFKVFDDAELIVGICAENAAEYTRKQLDELTEFVKRPQIGMKGMVWIRKTKEGVKSSVDKFYTPEDLAKIADRMGAKEGDLMLLLSGDADKTRKAMNELRLEMGNRLGLRDRNKFAPLWVLDFPLLEWLEDENRFMAMHHPFTSAKPEDLHKLDSKEHATLASIRADAYDLAMNGVELGGGSIRIYDRSVQAKMFELLGFSEEEARLQFGFLLDAFEYGAPPHGGLAFGFDRLCAMFGGSDSIRDYIAFPKNNAGRDMMIESPSPINPKQLGELGISIHS